MKPLSVTPVRLVLALSLLWTGSVAAAAEPQEKGQAPSPVPKLSAEPRPSVEPKLSTEPKPPAEPKPFTELKPSTEPKSSADPKPPAEPRPSVEPKPTAEPPLKPQPTPQPKPDLSPEKETAKKPMGSLILTVKLALLADPRLFQYDMEVDADEQTVTLAGRVAREEDIEDAVAIARAVPGVQSVVSKIQTDKTLAQALLKKQDEHITALIKERFARSATLKAANFDVKTDNGIVWLSGSVRFQVFALEAAEAARHVPGVRAVKTDQVRLEGES